MGCLFCSFFARPLAPGARPGVLLPLLVNGVRKILTWVTVEAGQAATCSTCLPARKVVVVAHHWWKGKEGREEGSAAGLTSCLLSSTTGTLGKSQVAMHCNALLGTFFGLVVICQPWHWKSTDQIESSVNGDWIIGEFHTNLTAFTRFPVSLVGRFHLTFPPSAPKVESVSTRWPKKLVGMAS